MCLDFTDSSHALVTKKDPLYFGGFLPCLLQSAQNVMPEGLQGLGELLMVLLLLLF